MRTLFISRQIVHAAVVFCFGAVNAAKASSTELPLLAVMPLAAKNLPSDTAEILDELLIKAIVDRGLYRVIGTADVNRLLTFEKQKDALGCDDVSCLADIGGQLGAQLLLTGTVGKLGDKVIISLVFFRVNGLKTTRKQVHVPNEEAEYERGLHEALSLVLGSGGLTVQSTPMGAELAVNGKSYGATPTKVPSLPSGRHIVVLRMPNHDEIEQSVLVYPNETALLAVSLVPHVGKIAIASRPAGATCYLEGKAFGVSPCHLDNVPVGIHRVETRLEHHRTATRDLTVVRGKTEAWTTELEPLPVPIAITTDPSGATVSIEGRKNGLTNTTVSLLPGTYDVEIELEGFANTRRTLTVEAGERRELAVVLEPGLSATEERWQTLELVARWGLTGLAVASAGVWIWQGVQARKLERRAETLLVSSTEFQETRRRGEIAAGIADGAMGTCILFSAGSAFLWLRAEF